LCVAALLCGQQLLLEGDDLLLEGSEVSHGDEIVEGWRCEVDLWVGVDVGGGSGSGYGGVDVGDCTV